MTEISAKEVFGRRLPVYAYLEPLLVGRTVLEVSAGAGASAAHLASRGAAQVVGIDTDAALIEQARARHGGAAPNVSFRPVASLLDLVPGGPFDVVLVPDAEALLRRPEAIPALSRQLAPGGRLVLIATSSDRRGSAAGGVGYYELADALVPHFSAVQMFGVTPFAGFGVVEFDAEGDGLRVDSRLADQTDEAPSAYVAVAGGERALDLGYALVQVPFGPIEAKLSEVGEVEDRGASARLVTAERRLDEVERRARARVEEAEGRVGELRRKLDDVEAEAASSVRVARAQGEEIEELRARLRRAAEDRASLDGEVAKLRRALADADESVMTLTRRTAEEMSAVAARLAESLRAPAPAWSPPREDSERLRAALAETEARASAAEQRLEEIGSLGRERQAALDDVLERLRQAEEATSRERREVARLRAALDDAGARARGTDERESVVASRDERIARLEGEKQELVWRLAELEEKLRKTIGHSVIADKTGRVQADALDEARASRARALQDFQRAAGAHVDEVTSLRASVAEQTALVAELEEALRVAEATAETATVEAATLRKNAKGLEEADRARRTRLAELEGKLLRLEHEKKQAAASAPAPAAPVDDKRARELAAELAASVRDRDELRANLARVANLAADTEDTLAKVTAELVAARARATNAETEASRLRSASGATNGRDHVSGATARELGAIEAGLREELATLAALESAIESQLGASASPATDRVADVDAGADAILLHTTLGNYRRHAARLRDELEGVRRRLDSLSPSEISGYLEELGEDLAEMEE
jgi:SAM-dependent methyltransferase